jgi:hypothetical protein
MSKLEEFKKLQSEVQYYLGREIPNEGDPVFIKHWSIWSKIDILLSRTFPIRCYYTAQLNGIREKDNFSKVIPHFGHDYIDQTFELSIIYICTIHDNLKHNNESSSLFKCMNKICEFLKQNKLLLDEYLSFFNAHDEWIYKLVYEQFIKNDKYHHIKEDIKNMVSEAHDLRSKYICHSEIGYDLNDNQFTYKKFFELLDKTIEAYSFINRFLFSVGHEFTRYEASIKKGTQFLDYHLNISPENIEKYVYQTRNKINSLMMSYSDDPYRWCYPSDEKTA